MKRVFVLLAVSVACLAVVDTASARDSNATYRLSWNSCQTQVVDQLFAAPGIYKLVLSGDNFTSGPNDDDNVFFDFSVDVRPLLGLLPDAWRFDAAGCQGVGYVAYSLAEFSPDCPSMAGEFPLGIYNYGVDPLNPTYASMRLAVAYNTVSPLAGTRYTFCQVSFDHTYSVAGASVPPNTCGHAEAQLSVEVRFALLGTERGDSANLQLKAGDQSYVTWNTPPVPTMPVTWGKVKGLYR